MRIIRVLLVGALSAAGLAMTAAPALPTAADPPCSAHVVMPSRVAMQTEFLLLPSTYYWVATDDPIGVGGTFSLVSGGHTLASGSNRFYPTVPTGLYFAPHLHAAALWPGTYTAVGEAAEFGSDTPCTWVQTSALIKFGGNGGIGSYRAGSVVTIAGLFHEYRAAGFTYPVGRTEYLQRYTGSGWQNIAAARVGSNGRTSVSFVQPAVAQYRWVSVDNPLTFGFSTPSTFR